MGVRLNSRLANIQLTYLCPPPSCFSVLLVDVANYFIQDLLAACIEGQQLAAEARTSACPSKSRQQAPQPVPVPAEVPAQA